MPKIASTENGIIQVVGVETTDRVIPPGQEERSPSQTPECGLTTQRQAVSLF